MMNHILVVQKQGASQKLTFAERWFRDGISECALAGSCVTVEADVTRSAEFLASLRTAGSAAKWTALFVRATALALHRNPDLNVLVAGNTKLRPDSVDICLSVSSEQAITPVVILENCAQRGVEWLAAEIARITPLARESDRKMVLLLNRWGYFGFTTGLRRRLVRVLLNRMWYRRKVSGTFQVSCLPTVDIFLPLRFNTAAVLGIGQVKERPFAAEGSLQARHTVFLTICFDHGVWNGADASRFVNAVKEVMMEADFRCEAASTPQ